MSLSGFDGLVFPMMNIDAVQGKSELKTCKLIKYHTDLCARSHTSMKMATKDANSRSRSRKKRGRTRVQAIQHGCQSCLQDWPCFSHEIGGLPRPMMTDFHGHELLLLRKLQNDPALCYEWLSKLKNKLQDDDYDLGEIPHSLWFLAVTLDRKRSRFLEFVQQWLNRESGISRRHDTLLGKYLNDHQFTELHLDGIFKYGDDNTLPVEIFKCPSVCWLSLKYNYLDRLPADIGRMAKLDTLSLTNNKLQNKSIPFTLTFCSNLHTLLLDNNLLDALPGFLLNMPALKTVHRHGNHNYFKSTFMWYHTDVNERILAISGTNDFMPREPESLQFWAARTIIGLKLNFYAEPSIAPVLKDYISENYTLFNVCGHCNTAKLSSQPGYKVITFKNPYLGNTCVPFQHWACSLRCAQAIEIPARHEQIAAARELDHQYDAYIRDCQRHYNVNYAAARRLVRRTPSNASRGSCIDFNPSCRCTVS